MEFDPPDRDDNDGGLVWELELQSSKAAASSITDARERPCHTCSKEKNVFRNMDGTIDGTHFVP